jgi:hypothetical protein
MKLILAQCNQFAKILTTFKNTFKEALPTVETVEIDWTEGATFVF